MDKEKECELCMVDTATVTIDYRGVLYEVCDQCRFLAENE